MRFPLWSTNLPFSVIIVDIQYGVVWWQLIVLPWLVTGSLFSGHWQLLPLFFQVHEYLRGEKRCLVGVRSQCLFANRLPLCSSADPLCGSLRGRWIVPLGFASRGLKATTWNRSRNTTPRQLGPQWGRFFRIHPFCVAKYYLRANKMRNLGAAGRRGKMCEHVAGVFWAMYVWSRELLQRTPCPLKSHYLVMYKQGGGLGAVDSTGGCKADAVPFWRGVGFSATDLFFPQTDCGSG